MSPSSTLRFVSESVILSNRKTLSLLSSCLLRALTSTYRELHRPLTYSVLRRSSPVSSSVIRVSSCHNNHARRFHPSSSALASHYDTLGILTRRFHLSSSALASHYDYHTRRFHPVSSAFASHYNTLGIHTRRFHPSSSAFVSHYDTLGIPSTATPEEVKQAFYRLSKELHPDLNPDSPNAVEKFKLVSAAYDVIGNPEKRRQYDAELRPELRRQKRDFRDPQSSPGFNSSTDQHPWRQRSGGSSGNLQFLRNYLPLDGVDRDTGGESGHLLKMILRIKESF